MCNLNNYYLFFYEIVKNILIFCLNATLKLTSVEKYYTIYTNINFLRGQIYEKL